MAFEAWAGYDEASVQAPPGSLTDFSLLVDLSRLSASWWGNVASDGRDIRCARGDDTELPFDLIAFDHVARTGLLRVRWIGSLTSLGGDTLRVYAGNPAATSYAATDMYGQYNAYDASWAAYWPDGAGGDRTANASHMVASGGLTAGAAAGQVGAATAYDGTDDYAQADSEALRTAVAVTALAWFNAQKISDYQRLVTSQQFQKVQLVIWNDNTLRWIVHDGTSNRVLTIGAANWTDDTWHMFVGTADSSASIAYLDGAQANSMALTGVNVPAGDDVRLGANPEGQQRLNGLLDDVQIHSAARSAAWIAYEYAQSSDQASFWGAWAWTAAGGGGGEVEVTFSHAASGTTGYSLSVVAQPASRTLAHTASGTTGYSLSVVAQPASRTLAHTASGTTGYGFSIAAGTPAGSVTLSHAASATAGYSLAPQAQASTRALGHSASTTAGYGLSVEAGAPGTDTVRLSHAASATTGYSLSVGAQPSTRTLGHGASETVGYGLAIGAGGQIIALGYGASQTAGYGFDVTAQLARVALGYVDSVTVGYALRVQDGKAETPQVITLSLESTHMLTLSLESSHSLTLSIGN